MAGANYYRCRKDNTQDEIKHVFEMLGYFVIDIHSLKGLFDLIAKRGNQIYFVECKSKGGKLSSDEVIFHHKCPEPIYVLESAEQVEALVLRNEYDEPKRISKQLNGLKYA